MVGIWAQRMKLMFIFIDLLGDSLGPSCTNKTYVSGILEPYRLIREITGMEQLMIERFNKSPCKIGCYIKET